MEQYNPNVPTCEATAHLQQVCGQLHYNGLKYGVLHTDECFWFLRYETDSAQGVLNVSEGIVVEQRRPTVFLMLLTVGHLAQQHASNHATPSFTRRQPLPLNLDFWGSIHQMTLNTAPAESMQHQLRMGTSLGKGSTGSVHIGRIEDVGRRCKVVGGG